MNSETVEIWTDAATTEGKAALPALGRHRIEVTHVPTAELTDNLGALVAQVQAMLDSSEQNNSSFVIDEIELNVGINAKGGMALIGKLEAGASAGLKVKLKRRTP